MTEGIKEGIKSGTSDSREGKERLSTAGVDPRYVYYRLYAKEGALKSNNPIYSDDSFISRILSNSVTPPYTVALVKRRISWIEGFTAVKECNLYLSLSEKTPVEDPTRIQLREKDRGPGLFAYDPIALVIDVLSARKRSPATSTVDSTELPKWLKDEVEHPRYSAAYYRVFDENGEVASKTSFNDTKVGLGRINVLSISPPHTGASLKCRLVKAEGVVDQVVHVFEDEGGDTTIEDRDSVDLLSNACPGIIEHAPMAFVQGPQEKNSDTKPEAPVPGFSKQLKATGTYDCADYDPAWQSTKVGELFKTDGVLRHERYRPTGWINDCYEAINSSGKRACLFVEDTKFC